MADETPEPLLSPDGKWGYFFSPREDRSPSEDEPWEPPAEGSTIRFMGEEATEVPLWCGGLLFDEREELVSLFGVSEELASDIAAWATAWDAKRPLPELDHEAANLVRRLNRELGYRYDFVYKP